MCQILEREKMYSLFRQFTCELKLSLSDISVIKHFYDLIKLINKRQASDIGNFFPVLC